MKWNEFGTRSTENLKNYLKIKSLRKTNNKPDPPNIPLFSKTAIHCALRHDLILILSQQGYLAERMVI